MSGPAVKKAKKPAARSTQKPRPKTKVDAKTLWREFVALGELCAGSKGWAPFLAGFEKTHPATISGAAWEVSLKLHFHRAELAASVTLKPLRAGPAPSAAQQKALIDLLAGRGYAGTFQAEPPFHYDFWKQGLPDLAAAAGERATLSALSFSTPARRRA